MNWKQLSTAGLILTMACSSPACAAGARETVLTSRDAPLSGRYAASVSVNGEELEEAAFTSYDEETGEEETVVIKISELPAAPSGYLPMRALCAADPDGFAYWSQEENVAVFILNGNNLIVSFDDLSVEWKGEKLEGAEGYLSEGVTFLPASVLSALDGITVNGEDGSERYDVVFEINPLEVLANAIRENIDMGMGERMTGEVFELLEVNTANFEDLTGYMPMMINADTILIGKYAPGADKAAARKDFEGRKQATIQNFENYLPDPLEMAKNGQIVESKDGNYLMLIISADNDKAIEMFEAGVTALSTGDDLEQVLSGFSDS